jgi:hypothetical protein
MIRQHSSAGFPGKPALFSYPRSNTNHRVDT